MSNATPFVKEICQYLAANSSGVFTFGTGNTNLKAGELVRDVDGVFAVPSPSPEPDRDVIYETHIIDFWARNKNTATAYEQLRTIYNLFHQNHHYPTNLYLIEYSHALGQPEDQDRDAEGGKLLRLSVEFLIRQLIS